MAAAPPYPTLPPAPHLPWRTGLRIAWRELMFSRAKFLFVVLSVAIGVGALTGVRGFATSFSDSLLGQARSLLAADLAARINRQLDAREQSQLTQFAAREGGDITEIHELASMATVQGDPVPLLISLKVVDPARYPFYGSVRLLPSQPLAQALGDGSVVVDENLLVRLHTHVGAELRIGGQEFRIAGLLVREPDRLTAGVGLGPRVMMSQASLNALGLLQPGSRSTLRVLFRLPHDVPIARARFQLEHILPEAQIGDYREGAPELTRGLDQARGLLSLICLVAMVLGAIGVAMAMRAHLQQRIDGIAIMKAMGARSADVLRIYVLETLLLGTGGALLGVAIGLLVEWVLPHLLASLLPLQPALRVPWAPVLGAFSTGILTTMLFSLPPLLDVRNVRPSAVLRRMVESGEPARSPIRSAVERLRRSWLQWIIVVVIVGALAVIAALLSDSWEGGTWFAGSLTVALLALLLLSAGLLRLLRAVLDRTRLSIPSTLRHGLANLYRPGNQSAAVLAALGVGVMLILSVFLMQRSILVRMEQSMAADIPNVFLIDIAPSELAGVRGLAVAQAGSRAGFEALPILTGHLDTLNGVPVHELHHQLHTHLLRSTLELTWSATPPPGITIAQGAWWAPGSSSGVAVVNNIAERLHLHVGSQIGFAAGDRHFTSTVSAIYKVDFQHISGRSQFIFPPTALAGLPAVWYAAVHMQPDRIGDLEEHLFARYPTVTAINIADILETIQRVVGHVTMVIRFLAGFSILSGMVILASSVASTRYRRVREVVVLKTLGATRMRIASVFSVEFLVLGLLAGAAGAAFANELAHILLHLAEVELASSARANIAAVLLTAALAVITGWVASFRILGQKPLEVLREE